MFIISQLITNDNLLDYLAEGWANSYNKICLKDLYERGLQ